MCNVYAVCLMLPENTYISWAHFMLLFKLRDGFGI